MQIPDSESQVVNSEPQVFDVRQLVTGTFTAARQGAMVGVIQGALAVGIVVGVVEIGIVVMRLMRAGKKV